MCPICKREYEDLSLWPLTPLATGAPGGGRGREEGGRRENRGRKEADGTMRVREMRRGKR